MSSHRLSSSASSIVAMYLVWSNALFNISAVNAADGSKSSIIAAAEQKHNKLLLSAINDNRQLQSDNSLLQLTDEQFEQCKTDMFIADVNSDGEIDKNEFLRFLSLNSEHYGYRWGFAGGQIALGDLPLEFPMLFHSTACMCAYNQPAGTVDFDCCAGDNEHVIVYPTDDMTAEQEAYTNLFCTEALNSYSATFMPSKSPTGSSSIVTPPPVTMTTMSPTDADVITTSSPTQPPVTPSPIPDGTTMSPTSVSPTSTSPTSSPISTATSSPTMSPSLKPSTSSPTNSPISSIISVGIQYGISSNCGMTAFDVMNGSYGITIKEGLIDATEVVVVDILNTTYPREVFSTSENDDANDILLPTMPPTDGMTSVPEEGMMIEGPSDPPTSTASDPFLPPTPVETTETGNETDTFPTMSPNLIEETNDPFMPPTPNMDMVENSMSAGHSKDPKNTMNGVRIRVDGLPSGSNRQLVMMNTIGGRSKQQHTLQKKQQQQREQDARRSLVYYTPLNPVVITDVEDVLDQACPEGINCMRVVSTIYVTLEEGDDAAEISETIRNGFQDSLQDASFFQAIPADTVFCPPDPSASPISVPGTTSEPTSSPSLGKVISSPPSLSPVDMPSSLPPTTMSPIATTGSPTQAGMTLSPVISTLSPVVSEGTSSPTLPPIAEIPGSSPPSTFYEWPTYSPTVTAYPSPSLTWPPTTGNETVSSSSPTLSEGTLSPIAATTVSPTLSPVTSEGTLSPISVTGNPTVSLSPISSGGTPSPSVGNVTTTSPTTLSSSLSPSTGTASPDGGSKTTISPTTILSSTSPSSSGTLPPVSDIETSSPTIGDSSNETTTTSPTTLSVSPSTSDTLAPTISNETASTMPTSTSS